MLSLPRLGQARAKVKAMIMPDLGLFSPSKLQTAYASSGTGEMPINQYRRVSSKSIQMSENVNERDHF